MISADLRFEGFDARSWTHLISLFSPAGVGDSREEGGVLWIVLGEEDQTLAAFHSRRGRISGLTYDPRVDPNEGLRALAERHRAHRVVVAREGVFEEIGERLAMRLHRGEDYIAQCLVAARILREMREAGMLRSWPDPLRNVPVPSMGMVEGALDSVLPNDRSLLLVAWEGSKPWTGLVLRRRKGEIDFVGGPDLIARWSGPLGGDWRRDHRVISDAVARALAPLHLGIFTEAATLRRLLRAADPGEWAKQALYREVILDPAPPYVAVALGADVARAVARRSARWLGGIDALSALGPLASYLRGRVAEVASVTALLGFDPLKALALWLESQEGPIFDEEEPRSGEHEIGELAEPDDEELDEEEPDPSEE